MTVKRDVDLIFIAIIGCTKRFSIPICPLFTLVHQLPEGSKFASRVLRVLLHQLPGHLLHIQVGLADVLLEVLKSEQKRN